MIGPVLLERGAVRLEPGGPDIQTYTTPNELFGWDTVPGTSFNIHTLEVLWVGLQRLLATCGETGFQSKRYTSHRFSVLRPFFRIFPLVLQIVVKAYDMHIYDQL